MHQRVPIKKISWGSMPPNHPNKLRGLRRSVENLSFFKLNPIPCLIHTRASYRTNK